MVQNNIIFNLFPLFMFFILVCNAMLFIFGGLITNDSPETEFGDRVNFLFGKLAFQFGIIFTLIVVITLFIGIISLICGNNYLKKLSHFQIFHIKYYHYIFLISLIDIISYLFLYKLVSPYSTAFLITEFFTEPIYLLYIIIYYWVFKKGIFKIKKIISSYSLFILGIILMIIGLSNFYSETKVIKNTKFNIDKYICIQNTNNYFSNYYYSIFIAIIILPFLYFIRILYAKKYMEITDINPFIFLFKINFTEFIISLSIYLINIKLEFNQKYNFDPVFWGLYSLASDIHEFLFLLYLKYSNIYYIFVFLVFRKLHFHALAGISAQGIYFLFLIWPIITNVLGFITFYIQSDKNNKIFQFSLIEIKNEKEENIINSKDNIKYKGIVNGVEKEFKMTDDGTLILVGNENVNNDELLSNDIDINNIIHNDSDIINLKQKKDLIEEVQNLKNINDVNNNDSDIINLKENKNLIKENQNQKNKNKNKELNNYILNDIIKDSTAYYDLDNTFAVFKSIDNIIYIIYVDKSNSIIGFNLIENKPMIKIKNAHKKNISNLDIF